MMSQLRILQYEDAKKAMTLTSHASNYLIRLQLIDMLYIQTDDLLQNSVPCLQLGLLLHQAIHLLSQRLHLFLAVLHPLLLSLPEPLLCIPVRPSSG